MRKVETIKNKDGEEIFPLSSAKATVYSDTEKTAYDAIENVKNRVTNLENTGSLGDIVLDSTLTMEKGAANAKIVGDKILDLEEKNSRLSESIAEIEEDLVGTLIYNDYYRFSPPLEEGTYQDGTSTKVANNRRFRSVDFIRVDKLSCMVYVPENYLIWINEFDENKQFIKSISDYKSGSFIYKFDGDYALVIFKKYNGGYIDDDIKSFYIEIPSAYKNDHNTITAKMEHGAIIGGDYYHSEVSFRNSRRTSYFVSVNGASDIILCNNMIDWQKIRYVDLYFYDSGFTYLSYKEIVTNGKRVDSVSNVTGAEYIKVVLVLHDTSYDIRDFNITLYGNTEKPREIKNTQMLGTDSVKLSYGVYGDVFTTARLMLPQNYSVDGEKVPMILFLPGSGLMQYWDSDFPTAYTKGYEYLKAEGFAILAVYAWGNKYANKYGQCGKAQPYPIPTNLECIKKGIEFVCDRFNIDSEQIHIMGHSQGGQLSLYYATHPEFGIKTIGMFSPVLDYLSMPGESMYADTRKAIADDIGMTGDVAFFGSDDFCAYSDAGKAFLRENAAQLCAFNEAWTGLVGGNLNTRLEDALADCEKFWTEQIWSHPEKADTIYTNREYAKLTSIPVKIWGAYDDDQTPYLKMVEVVDQIRNGGGEAWLRTFESGASTGGHNCATAKNTIPSVVTKTGVTVNDVPSGWVENVDFIRQHMAK